MKQNHEVIQTLANNNINMYDIDPITCNLSKENKQIAEQRLLAEQSIAQHRADIANCEKKRINVSINSNKNLVQFFIKPFFIIID